MKNSILLVIVFSALISCRKEVSVAPSKVNKNESYLFMEVDDYKFLIDDKLINVNKNTIGSIQNFTSSFREEEIYLSIDYKNTKPQKGFCYGQLWLNCKPKIGYQRPKYIRVNAKLMNDVDNAERFNFSIENNRVNPQSNSLIDSLIYIRSFNIENNSIEFEYTGNFYDVFNSDTTMRKLKLKASINLKE